MANANGDDFVWANNLGLPNPPGWDQFARDRYEKLFDGVYAQMSLTPYGRWQLYAYYKADVNVADASTALHEAENLVRGMAMSMIPSLFEPWGRLSPEVRNQILNNLLNVLNQVTAQGQSGAAESALIHVVASLNNAFAGAGDRWMR